MDGYDVDLSMVECPMSEEDRNCLEYWLEHSEDPITAFMEWLLEG